MATTAPDIAALSSKHYLQSLGLDYVPGIGKKTREKLANFAFKSLYDVLFHLPYQNILINQEK